MNDERPPLRAVFLDIGDTVMRPNPSWEHVYAMAFEEFGHDVDIDDLHAALRRAYHHGGWGMEGGFEPNEETSFQRTVAIDAAAIAELGLAPMPEAFYRRLSELFMVTSHWHIFPDAYPALAGLQKRGLVVGAVSNWVWNLPEQVHARDLVRRHRGAAVGARQDQHGAEGGVGGGGEHDGGESEGRARRVSHLDMRIVVSTVPDRRRTPDLGCGLRAHRGEGIPDRGPLRQPAPPGSARRPVISPMEMRNSTVRCGNARAHP